MLAKESRERVKFSVSYEQGTQMKKILLALTTLFMLAGCASSLMSPTQDADNVIPKDKAVITFYRPSSIDIPIQAPIAREASDGSLEFVGVVSSGTKLRATVEPGDHTFVVGGEKSDLLKAKVQANKAYYVKLDQKIGILKDRFANVVIRPEELTNGPVQKDLKDAKLVEINSKGQVWFRKHYSSMMQNMVAAKNVYDMQSVDQKKTHTLTPEMGTDKLY